MPCQPPTINISPGTAPNGINGFGAPFAPSTSTTPTPPLNQPEDLNALFSSLEMIVPASILKAPLSSNYDKTVYDVITKLLNEFAPFLSLYTMFLPVLNIITCCIEVLCAIPNPFKLIEKIQQLFRKCIPEFLALFPQFALIIMIISILNILISLLEYIITEVVNLVAIIQENINIIERALTIADDRSILTATKKIGNVLCAFQNLFVILSLFGSIITIFEDIIKILFPIPPCSDSSDPSCCSSDVCPSFIKNNTDIKANTGTLQYFNEVGTSFAGIPFISDLRKESWQFYDVDAGKELAFINITHAFDLPDGYDTVFFPTDATYDATTPVSQAPYLVSLRLFYNPTNWGIVDLNGPRFIRINDCIVLSAPTINLSQYDNSTAPITNGVLDIAGGLVFEDDGSTPIMVDGYQATLNTFIHLAPEIGIITPSLLPTDGYTFSNVTYDFNIQHTVLLGKALITLGCVPGVGFDRMFINTVYGNNDNFTILNNLPLPNIIDTQLCLSAAVSALQNNISDDGLATFQATATACLTNAQNQATTALQSLIGVGFDQYKSTFTIAPTTQFTTQAIKVSVNLNEYNGAPLANNLSASVGGAIASNISAIITFGEISTFVYDGYSLFTANITSKKTGNGTIKVAYENKIIGTVNIPSSLSDQPSITDTVLNYNFIYSPSIQKSDITAEVDTDGAPRLDATDVSKI